MLARHLEDRNGPRRTDLVVVFEPPSAPGTQGLALRGWDSPRTAQVRWAKRVPPFPGFAVYHNGWGASFLAHLDGCHRRIALWHSPWPGVEENMANLKGVFDFVMTVSQPLAELAGSRLGLPPERLAVLPVPIDPPVHSPPDRSPLQGRPVVFGYAGRLVSDQKRVERLVPLVRELAQAGLHQQWEILGEGPAREGLQSEVASTGVSATFHGRLAGDAFWDVLRRLDFIVFTSDYEGMPISLLEAMSQGVLPLYARMNSGGDSYAARLDSSLLYPVESPGIGGAGCATTHERSDRADPCAA